MQQLLNRAVIQGDSRQFRHCCFMRYELRFKRERVLPWQGTWTLSALFCAVNSTPQLDRAKAYPDLIDADRKSPLFIQAQG